MTMTMTVTVIIIMLTGATVGYEEEDDERRRPVILVQITMAAMAITAATGGTAPVPATPSRG